MKKFINKATVGIIVGVATLMLGSVMCFASTEADEAEAKYQAEQEELRNAQLIADAAAEDAARDAFNEAAAAVEEAYDNYIKDQAAYFEAKDDEYFKGIYAVDVCSAVPGAKADAGIAKDEADGKSSKVKDREAEEALALSFVVDARNAKLSDAEIDKLEDKYQAAKDAAELAREAADDAADHAADMAEIALDAVADCQAAHADWVDAANYMYATLAVF